MTKIIVLKKQLEKRLNFKVPETWKAKLDEIVSEEEEFKNMSDVLRASVASTLIEHGKLTDEGVIVC